MGWRSWCAVAVAAAVVVAGCSDGARPRAASASGSSQSTASGSTASGSTASTGPALVITPAPPPSEAPQTTARTLTYCAPGGRDLSMDLYLPQDTSSPVPVALHVHGGGWTSGHRSDGDFVQQLVPELTSRGVAVASIDYRLAPRSVFPAQIEDVACAVRFLREQASTLHLDPNRIAAWGGSAGGHLVSLLGTMDPSAGFDTAEHAGQSSRVVAVADLFGPSDLPALLRAAGPSVRSDVGGGANPFGVAPGDPNAAAVLARYSPVTYITLDDPPFLILQGDADTTVPESQSQELAQRLDAAGVPEQLVIVHHGPHGLDRASETPSPPELVQQLTAFLVGELRR